MTAFPTPSIWHGGHTTYPTDQPAKLLSPQHWAQVAKQRPPPTHVPTERTAIPTTTQLSSSGSSAATVVPSLLTSEGARTSGPSTPHQVFPHTAPSVPTPGRTVLRPNSKNPLSWLPISLRQTNSTMIRRQHLLSMHYHHTLLQPPRTSSRPTRSPYLILPYCRLTRHRQTNYSCHRTPSPSTSRVHHWPATEGDNNRRAPEGASEGDNNKPELDEGNPNMPPRQFSSLFRRWL